MNYGILIKQIRKRNHLTQKEFAETLGVTQACISRVECNDNGISKHLINLISKTFETPELKVPKHPLQATSKSKNSIYGNRIAIFDAKLTRTLSEALKQKCDDSCIHSELLQSCKEYKNLVYKEEAMRDILHSSGVNEDILNEYEEILSGEYSIQADVYYSKGLRDGMNLAIFALLPELSSGGSHNEA